MKKKKQAYLIAARNEKPLRDGLPLGDRTIRFKKGTVMKTVYDKALADEIDKVHGLKGNGDVWVLEDERTEHVMTYHPEQGHRYFFGSNSRYREGYDRIFGRKKNGELD